MPREAFERELQRLQGELLTLGGMVEEAITASVESLRRQDLEAARRVIDRDREINEQRFAIERDTLILIATQQPMAGDLRVLAAILEITTELERMGDYAKGIAKICLMIGKEPLLKPLIDIPRMAEKARDMLHRALDAFTRRDVEQARAIPEEDDEVDALYEQIYRELITFIMADPHNIEQANYLLWAAHNLERTADRVTNICERVIFTVTGEMTELNEGEERFTSVEGSPA
ncbi:MAG TPA: phosphate signaling complex protein PhoU [Anaerolineales bacterium]|nr:phosphate signaling complex protein PhoU [Anaerolineae bacterium]HIP87176.1 phosphate signaling complex protein PhoU [Anaerolineales bacterium]